MAKSNKPQIIISPLAKEDISNIIRYLKEHWDEKVVDLFLKRLEIFYQIISINPRLFGYYNRSKNIRKYSISKQNIVYYRCRKNVVEVITVFGAMQEPAKLKKIIKKLSKKNYL